MITTSAQFNEYSDATSSLKFQAYKPSLEHALEKYIYPVLGMTYYAELAALNAPSPEQTTLIKHIKKAWVSFTLYEYSFISEIVLTDAGLRRGGTEDLPNAYKYQVENYRKSILDRGLHSLEAAILQLEVLVRTNAANAWKDSEEFKTYRNLMLNSGNEFAKILPFIRYPRRLFLLLSNSIYTSQIFTIYQTIGADVYDPLLTKIKTAAPNLSSEETELLTRIKYALAHLSFASGISTLIAQMDENGIHVLSNNADSTSSTSKRVGVNNSIIDKIIEENKRIGELWLGKIVDYLREKATANLWPTWVAETTTAEYIPTGVGML